VSIQRPKITNKASIISKPKIHAQVWRAKFPGLYSCGIIIIVKLSCLMAKLHDNLFLLVKPKAPHRNIKGTCKNLTPIISRLCGTYIWTTPKLPYFGPLEYLKTPNNLECVGSLIPSPSYLCEIHGDSIG
jgi:hypothetical protein